MTRLAELLADAVGETTPKFSFDDVVARAASRRARRRVGTAMAITVLLSALLVGVAFSLGHKTTGPVVAVSPTTSDSVSSAWCVSVSRTDAVTRVMLDSAEVPHSAYPAGAKLMSGAELDAFGPPHSVPSRARTKFWVVEVIGPVHPAFAEDSNFGWGLFAVDATSGLVTGVMAGPEAAPPHWDAMPDHTQDCTTPPTTPPWANAATSSSTAACSAPTGKTFTAWDHATNHPVQVNRAYFCRRTAELNPPPNAHLSGSLDIENGKVVAQYYRTTDVMSVDAHGISTDTAVASKDPVPIDQLPVSIQDALRKP
jgi:hypothetical protein